MYDKGEERRPQGLGEYPRDHEVRVQILDLLADGRELTAGEVCEQLPGDRSPAAVHYHLLVLRRAKAVRASSGNEPRYRLP